MQAAEDVVRGFLLPTPMEAHQLKSVSVRIFIDMAENIPIFQPRTDDTKSGKAR